MSTVMGMLILVLNLQIANASETEDNSELKTKALKVLESKCNVCHVRKNPKKVFHLYNMSGLAPKIYKQVFVKKRMPKGNKIQLTRAEYETLKNWLETQNLKSD